MNRMNIKDPDKIWANPEDGQPIYTDLVKTK